MIGSPERREGSGGKDDSDDRAPDRRPRAGSRGRPAAGDGHERHGGFPRRCVPSDSVVKFATVATALIAAAGLAVQLAR